jgi:hypothetical protein
MGARKRLAFGPGPSDGVSHAMDADPELDVTLSNGRQVAIFQIAALAGREAWAVVEPRAPLRVIHECAAALAIRQRVDTDIAARLVAGWVPVDRRSASTPSVAPTPLSSDVRLQIGSLLEGLMRARAALRAADSTGQLWAACQVFRQQAWRFGVAAPEDRLQRARQERRLGELAEEAGDRAAAIRAYRLALASYPRVGVKRRLAQLVAPEPVTSPAEAQSRRVRRRIACLRAAADSTGLAAATERSCVRGRHARPHPRRQTMQKRIQIVGRLPVALSRRVRAAATQRQISLNTLLIEALTQALGGSRRVTKPEAR